MWLKSESNNSTEPNPLLALVQHLLLVMSLVLLFKFKPSFYNAGRRSDPPDCPLTATALKCICI